MSFQMVPCCPALSCPNPEWPPPSCCANPLLTLSCPSPPAGYTEPWMAGYVGAGAIWQWEQATNYFSSLPQTHGRRQFVSAGASHHSSCGSRQATHTNCGELLLQLLVGQYSRQCPTTPTIKPTLTVCTGYFITVTSLLCTILHRYVTSCDIIVTLQTPCDFVLSYF